jgi:hypothetical protein
VLAEEAGDGRRRRRRGRAAAADVGSGGEVRTVDRNWISDRVDDRVARLDVLGLLYGPICLTKGPVEPDERGREELSHPRRRSGRTARTICRRRRSISPRATSICLPSSLVCPPASSAALLPSSSLASLLFPLLFLCFFPCLYHMAPKMCVWRRLGVRHKRLGVVKGVRRHATPRRLKTMLPLDITAH